MGCLKCLAIAVPVVAVLSPLTLSLMCNGWINDYVPPPGWSIDQMPDMSGKVVVVTGPTINGIGYESCVEMAKKGAHVVLAGRSKSKGEAALAALKERVPTANAEFMTLDLGSLKSVKEFADAFLQKDMPLHILLNNAGVMANPFTLTADGIESQFGTNHVGHFLLTKLLLPKLEASAPSRIVSVSSAAAFIPEGFFLIAPFGTGAVNWTDIYADHESRYEPWAAYGRSKLANVLFASRLDKRLAGKKVYSNSCHPGGIKTNLARHLEADMKKDAGERIVEAFEAFQNYVSMTPSQGAVTQLYLSASPDIESKEIRGKYYYPQARLMDPPKFATEASEEELWALSERLVAPYL
jgi:NAD(P)-dependent dehydrogenase (short-subunit alcohol dehydrogenase family)